MNTKDRWLLTVTIVDPERRERWIKIFPYASMPIKSVETVKVNVPGHEKADAYMLDLDAISDEQCEGVARIVAMTIGIPIEEARAEIFIGGLPILAEGVNVILSDEDSDQYDGLDEDDRFEDYEEN